MRIHSLVAASVLSLMACVGSAHAMPIVNVGNPTFIEKAQVIVRKTIIARRRPVIFVRRRPTIIVRRPTVIRKTIIVR